MTRDDVMQLFRHMEWADSAAWKALLAIGAARVDARLRERLHHVHLVQRIYLQMWHGEAHEVRELDTFASLDELYAWAREGHHRLGSFTSALNAAHLQREVTFPWADELVKWFGAARPATLQETIIQIVMHTAHHRGQINTMIRELGGAPPLVDFIGWVWMGKPEPEWPQFAESGAAAST